MSRGGWNLMWRALSQILRQTGRSSRTPRPLMGQRRGTQEFEASPGQFGEGATRDLHRDELSGLKFSYDPHPDGDPDPGEVVWTWVPYVENDGRGKDRPVLILARIDSESVAGCYLTTKHRHGFVNIGTGGWDSRGRDSFLSPERVLRVSHSGMRREGQALDRERFIEAARAVARHWKLTP